jgi:hypothetical protein
MIDRTNTDPPNWTGARPDALQRKGHGFPGGYQVKGVHGWVYTRDEAWAIAEAEARVFVVDALERIANWLDESAEDIGIVACIRAMARGERELP